MVLDQGFDRPDCRAIVLGKEGWHPGVVGTVASRLVEEFSRPVVLLNIAGTEAHGSARSVDGISIHEAFTACGDHLATYGGHAMAAGLRLQAVRIATFRQALVTWVNDRLSPDELRGLLNIDAWCDMEDLRPELFDQIQGLAPFGQGNRAPVLALRQVSLAQAPRHLGTQGKHLRLMLKQNGRLREAVWFGAGELAPKLAAGMVLDVAFAPVVSTFRGLKRLELHVQDVRKSAG